MKDEEKGQERDIMQKMIKLLDEVRELGTAQADEITRLKEELLLMRQWVRAVAHNLNNPLTGVYSNLQMIARLSPDKEQMVEYAEAGFQAAERMRQMILTLLTSKIELDKVDFNQLIADVISDLQVLIEESRAKITCDELPTVIADFVGLYQVFQNLIANAIKFCGGDVPVIHISATIKDKQIIFSVSDNGIGILTEKLEAIFDESEHDDDYEGYGIGLHSCRQILDTNGGRIWAMSEGLGKGSMFHFTIPIAE